MPYATFAQACRAFKPTELMPVLARISAAQGEPPYAEAIKQKLAPWGLAAAARDSLLYGNEFRDKRADMRALERLMRTFNISGVPPESSLPRPDLLIALMTRLTYEQFPYQESMYEEVSRSHAMLIDGLEQVATEIVTPASIAEMLGGIPLREAVGATFLLQVGAFQNGGVYDPSWLDLEHFKPVLDLYPRASIEAMAARLTITPSDFRDAFRAHSVGTSETARFDYNPLVATPFVDMGDGVPIAPAARLILRSVTPGSLYYAGIANYGPDFARELGYLFEHYVGRQLKLIATAEVHPEIFYGKGDGRQSVDWFVVLPGLVVLVEVKSRRLTAAAQAGDEGLLDVLSNTLGKARKQLGRTVEQLAEANPAFAHIPTDRPMLALVVTSEPFYTGAAYLMNHDVAVIPGVSLPDVPIAVASARELEWLVTHDAGVEGILLELIATRGDGVVSLGKVGKPEGAENPILTKAWESYPWPSPPAGI
ncbi:hypothetical protein [Nocardioides furvisabuli]|uniref:hypothetical protein n=1 Tax=Nocardioides furvisabuli TaxID=375542 RepID=UPI001E5CED6F|nr:hypothetical protein [Nocardioides furvisabuli]